MTVALVVALLVMAVGTTLFVRAYSVRDAVLPGFSVAGIDLGGLSREDAQARLQAELGPKLNAPVRVSVDGHTMVVRPGKTWSLDVAATVERAYQASPASVRSWPRSPSRRRSSRSSTSCLPSAARSRSGSAS